MLVSIGMSNTSQEFSEFKQVADSDPEKSAALVGEAACQVTGALKCDWGAGADARGML